MFTMISFQVLQLLTLLVFKVQPFHAFVGTKSEYGHPSTIWSRRTTRMAASAIEGSKATSIGNTGSIEIICEKNIQPLFPEETASWDHDQLKLILGIGAICLSAGLLMTTDILPANALDMIPHMDSASVAIETTTNLLSSSSIIDHQTSMELATTASSSVAAPIDWNAIFQKASKKALGGGKAGASAAVVQVFSLMWLRTSMNYQYRYGGNLLSSLQTLWQEGGIPRLYQGLPFALIQGPLTRFGDTAANVGILALLESTPETQALPLPIKTVLGSIAAGTWRIILMPIDASKTAMQVEGSEGLSNLWKLTLAEGPAPLYQGALASAAATAVGHFPWYTTYNYLNEALPEISTTDDLLLSLARSALIGFCASCVSDVCSNSLRVIKTTKQTARLSEKDSDGDDSSTKKEDISYAEVVKLIIEKDGVAGLFGRGLQTRLITNSVQGAVFSVLWKYFQQGSA